MKDMLNYFEILNISEKAEPEVIKASYRALSKKYHPDHSVLPEREAEIKMQLLNEAYQVLSDDQKKREYIKKLHETNMENFHEKDDADREYKHAEKHEKYAMNEEHVNMDENKKSPYEESLIDKIISNIVSVVILIAIICVLVHFVPDMVSEYVPSFKSGLDELLNNF